MTNPDKPFDELTRARYLQHYSNLLPDNPKWVYERLADDACEQDAEWEECELEFEKSKKEWLEFANEREKILAQVRAERDKLSQFYTEIVKELGDDLVLKRLKELRDELARQKVQNNHNWMFQEISEEALKRAEKAEAALSETQHELAVTSANWEELDNKLAKAHSRAAEIAAFSAWYVTAWERDPYDHDEKDVQSLWVKFRDQWLPSLSEEHCGDCTKVPVSCTRCHAEAYMKHGEIVAGVICGKEAVS
jgi:hypothetical protein